MRVCAHGAHIHMRLYIEVRVYDCVYSSPFCFHTFLLVILLNCNIIYYVVTCPYLEKFIFLGIGTYLFTNSKTHVGGPFHVLM